PRRARAVPHGGARRHRLDQLPDAVHDEAGLRAVPPAPRRSEDAEGDVRLLLLQPGPAPRPRRLRQSPRETAPEHGAGEADEPLADAAADEGAGGVRRGRIEGMSTVREFDDDDEAQIIDDPELSAMLDEAI